MDKASFLQTLTEGRAAWEALLAQVDPQRMQEPHVSGMMSVKDIIAHVAWYENQTLGMVAQRAVIGSDLWYRSLDERNAAIYNDNHERPLDEVLAEERQIYTRLFAALQELSEAELNDYTLWRHMPAEWKPWQAFASNTYEHYPQHIPDIQEWLARQT